MRRTTCQFSGQVQGVGFRYTGINLAQSYDLTGYVRNMSDGRVELVMEGEDAERKGLLKEVKEHMEAYIDQVQVVESAATGEFTRFQIRH